MEMLRSFQGFVFSSFKSNVAFKYSSSVISIHRRTLTASAGFNIFPLNTYCRQLSQMRFVTKRFSDIK